MDPKNWSVYKMHWNKLLEELRIELLRQHTVDLKEALADEERKMFEQMGPSILYANEPAAIRLTQRLIAKHLREERLVACRKEWPFFIKRFDEGLGLDNLRGQG